MPLLSFGCSLTYGQALESDLEKNTPSKLAWPQLLADELGLECQNHSVPGSSNKLILDKILNTKINQQDKVVVQWSYLARWCMFEPTERIDLGPWIKDHPFYKYVWNPIDCFFTNKIITDYAWLHLKTVGCDFVFAHIEKDSHYYWTEDDLEYVFVEDKFDHAKFIEKSIKSFNLDKATDNAHPGPESHKKFAEYLAKQPLFNQLTKTK